MAIGAPPFGHQDDMTTFGRDESAALLRDGYEFWGNLRAERGSEVVQARVLGQRATCVVGAEASRFFYEEPALERSSALPMPLLRPLFGTGAVHTLDDDRHRHRKSLFTQLLTPESAHEVMADVGRRWDERAAGWSGRVDLFAEVATLLFESGCSWAGLPDQGGDTAARARDMAAMVDSFGSFSARHWRGRAARRRTEAWVAAAVEQAREHGTGTRSPLDVVAGHRDERGRLLPVRTAAVEVINLVRPLVAVTWLVCGEALAMDSWPEVRRDVADGSITPVELAQEVRRFSPFVPFLAARATTELRHAGTRIPAGTLVVLDVWGTNHDPRTWREPGRFRPERFRETPVTPYNLVPQGGGDTHRGHRCPGEDLTLGVLIVLASRVAALPHRVHDRPNLRRMPPEPRCRIDVAG
jgi:fatty-acid peroxygenase